MRQTPDKMRAWLTLLRKKMNLKSLVVTLAAIVVFTTTYLLILPAFTLDKEEAAQQGGIDVVAEETAAMEAADESAEAGESKDAEVVTTDAKDEKAEAEKSGKESKAEGQKSSESKGAALQAEGKDFTVSVTPEGKADVPDSAELQVAELKSTDKDLKDYRKAALSALKEDSSDVKGIKEIKVYDMSLESDGKAVNTDSKFNVKIEYEEGVTVEDADNVRVLTFDDKKQAAVLDTDENKVETKVEAAGEKSNVTEASFETEGISKVAVVEVETIEKTVITADGKTYKVTVKYGKDAEIPAGATLDVKELTGDDYDAYLEKTASKLDKSADDLGMAKFFDITIKNGDDEVKIAAPVDVEIKLLDSDNLADSTQVLHFENENKADVVDSTVKGDTVEFAAEGFSVYAIIDEEGGHHYARRTINFYNGDEKVSTVIVKAKDIEDVENNVEGARDRFNKIVYDPGVGAELPLGYMFRGWFIPGEGETGDSYTSQTEPLTIEGVREYILDKPLTEDDEVLDVYAMVFKDYTITYTNQDNAVIKTDIVLSKNGSNENYTVNMSYTPKEQDEDFEGWNVVGGTDVNIITRDPLPPYPNGTQITIKGDVRLSVNTPKGAWLSFNENGRGVSYTAPQFVKTGELTVRPDDPTRQGYTFGGWYEAQTDAEGNPQKDADGNIILKNTPFSFGNTLAIRTDLYAKWNVNPTANYTVIIWKQNVSGEGYDYETAIPLSGASNSNVSTVTKRSDDTYVRVNGTNYQWTGFELNNEKTTTAEITKKIAPEGTTVVNVYYDRIEYTLTFQVEDYTYTPTTSTNSYYYYYGQLDDGSYVRIQQRQGQNGWWYDATPEASYYSWTRYTGTRYTRSNYKDWQTIKEIKALYQQNISDQFPIVGTNGVTYPTGTRWMPQTNLNVDGQQYFTPNIVVSYIDRMPPGNMTFQWNDPGQRTDKTMVYWVETINNTPSSPSAKTKTYKGKLYEEYKTVVAKYNGITVEDYINLEGFTHFEADRSLNYTVQTQGGTTTYYGNSAGDGVATEVNFYYTRDKYVINYMDGKYVDGNGVEVEDKENQGKLSESGVIYYNADISSYNKGQSNYYVPTEDNTEGKNFEGYTFGGWYIDSACTQPYTFSKMPSNNITVYAKWVQTQYRVFLHPNVPRSDTSLVWGQTNQAMNFRVTNGEKIADGQMVVGERAEHELIGWYIDEACTIPFNFELTELRDNTAGLSNYDKTVTMTDPWDQYGSDNATTNSDITGDNGGDRYWITKKLDLYAKWRSKLEGANGILVKYDAVQGKGQFGDGVYYAYNTLQPDAIGDDGDTIYYADSAVAIAHSASKSTVDGQEFKYWILQHYNSETGEYEDTTTRIFPGQDFEVLKSDAKQVVTEYSEGGAIVKATYTVQLKAVYGEADQQIKTHIDFYANTQDIDGDPIEGVTAETQPWDKKTYKEILINDAVDVLSANTVLTGDNSEHTNNASKYDGYEFIGWAKDPAATEPWLKLQDNGKYEVVVPIEGEEKTFTDVTMIAADELQPYDNLYALWKKKSDYTVTIKKVVEGTYDGESTFDIEATGLTDKTETYTLTGKGDATSIASQGQLEYLTEFSISEKEDPNKIYELKNIVVQQVSDAKGVGYSEDQYITLTPNSDGKFVLHGNILVTVTNKRAATDVIVKKELVNKYIGEEGAEFNFTANWGEGQSAKEEKFKVSSANSTGYKIENVPVGATLTITEAADTLYDYTVSTTSLKNSTDSNSAGNVISFTVPEDGDTITFTNTLNMSNFNLVKVDDHTPANKLEGAKFTLTRKNVQGSYVHVDGLCDDGITTDAKGEFKIEDLPTGEYELTETKAPEGYVIMEDSIKFKVEKDEDGSYVATIVSGEDYASADGDTITITNAFGNPLPHTGGIGTTIFYILGSLLVIGCGIVLVSRKRLGSKK